MYIGHYTYRFTSTLSTTRSRSWCPLATFIPSALLQSLDYLAEVVVVVVVPELRIERVLGIASHEKLIGVGSYWAAAAAYKYIECDMH